MVATLLASLALAAPAEPLCHGQFAPPTKAEQEHAQIEEFMRQRAEFGFRADEAYVRELIRRGMWESDVGYIPVTPEEDDYLRLRDRLELGAAATEYLARRPDVYGGLSVEDDWPREPYLLVNLTRDLAVHEARLERLARFPNNLRTRQVVRSLRELRQLQNRISDDWDALEQEGFYMTTLGADESDAVVDVELVTRRTDAAQYFTARYGPAVRVEVISTERTFLACDDSAYYEVSRNGRAITLHLYTSGSVTLERPDVIETADRVQVGAVIRVPHGGITDDAIPRRGRVPLSSPLGDRPVIDLADGRRLLQHGPSPGEPPCQKSKRLSRLDEFVRTRKELGLRHNRAFARRMLRRRTPYTRAERRYLAIRETLEHEDRVYRYLRRHAREYGGSSIHGRFPGKPYVVIRFTRRLRLHGRNLERLMKHPELLRVVRTRLSERELDAIGERIGEDAAAGDGFLDGYGDDGFLVERAYPDRGRLVVRVRTPRRDAAAYFRRVYGRAVRVIVAGRRYECRDPRF